MTDFGRRSGRAWPVVLVEQSVVLRPLRLREARKWQELRTANTRWLSPWEATHPEAGGQAPSYRQMVRTFRVEARAGRMLPFAIEVDGELAGQLTVSGISLGSLCSGQIGYWVDRRVAGRGVAPTAVALAVDHCLFGMGLHRVEANIRPENRASLRVAEKLGFRPEGLRRRFLHIDGCWRDHLTFALTAEDVPSGLLPRWRRIAQDIAAERANQASSHGFPSPFVYLTEERDLTESSDITTDSR
jgi:[ribosomal protein S5]-alanine N-acetyltransferase